MKAEIFGQYRGNTSAVPAAALQTGMLVLLNQATRGAGPAYFAQSYAWAPFMLVGDGFFSRR